MKHTQRGGSSISALVILVAAGFMVWVGFDAIMSFFKSPGTETTAVAAAAAGAVVGAATVQWWHGGWFFAEGLGWITLTLLCAPIVILTAAISVFTEWGDPCFNWKDEKYFDQKARSREILTTILFLSLVGFLQWGGIPIWQTIAEAPWYFELGGAIAFFIIGIVWSAHLWGNLFEYLNSIRKKRFAGDLLETRKNLTIIINGKSDGLVSCKQVMNR